MNISKKIYMLINILTFIFLATIFISTIVSIIFLDNKIDLRFVYLLLLCTVMNISVLVNNKDRIKYHDYVLEDAGAQKSFLFIFLVGIFCQISGIYLYIVEICNFDNGISSGVLPIATYALYDTFNKYVKKRTIDC